MDWKTAHNREKMWENLLQEHKHSAKAFYQAILSGRPLIGPIFIQPHENTQNIKSYRLVFSSATDGLPPCISITFNIMEPVLDS